MDPFITPLIADPWDNYALLDSGHGRKLERYGRVVVSRPEPQALWAPSLPTPDWSRADAVFTNSSEDVDGESGKWKSRDGLPESWPVVWSGITFQCRLMSFRHMGLFPEQLTHWSWVADRIRQADKPLKILNLFGYTGAASLAAAAAGAQVTHLDASKKAIQWAKDNQTASGLSDKPIRWICDDAKDFVARELRRNSLYDGIILDPPKFGRGPDGQRWQIEEDLAPFMADCAKLLTADARFMIATIYAMRLSSLTIGAIMQDVTGNKGGTVENGELLIRQGSGDRFLSTSLFARWSTAS